MSSKYGDQDNVPNDVRALNEIMGRQGSSLLIDVIAESCGTIANRFRMSAEERATLLHSLVEELREAILERT